MGARCRANTASGAALIVVDAVTRSVSIPLRRLAGRELIAARHNRRSAIEPVALSGQPHMATHAPTRMQA
ncbi:MAG: hypothetical protein QOF30_917 [Acidimicrobiaceae bacterium]|nr:hypothetical protein [Acidimicrobiaceae bacterium]